ADERGDVVGSGPGLPPHPELLAGPRERQLRKRLRDPAIASRVPEEDEVAVAEILGRDVRVVLDRELSPEPDPPLVREASEVRVGPFLDLLVPRLARPAHAEEGRRERVVDRPLEAGPLPVQGPPLDPLPVLPAERRIDSSRHRRLADTDLGPASRQPEGGDVLRFLDHDGAVLPDPRLDLGAAIMLLQREDLDPEATIVLQGPGDEADMAGTLVES